MRIEMFIDALFQWRWRLLAPNGRVLCCSADGYDTKPGVRRSIANFVKYLAVEVPVEEKLARAATDAALKMKVSRPMAKSRKA